MRYRVALVSSAGGHLAQLMMLRPWWSQHDRVWVTFDKLDTRERLQGERVVHAHGPTNRHVPNFVRNLSLARRVLTSERPDVVISTGAGLAVPFFWWARALGIPTVFVEVYDRIEKPSLTGQLVAPLADRVVLQWEEQLAFYPRGVLLGPML